MSVYRLIMHTIKEYRPNELYASQWLSLIIIQAQFTDANNDIGSVKIYLKLN